MSNEETPQGAEGSEGTVGEDSPYQLAVSVCRKHMTEGNKDKATDEYNEAIVLNQEAENDELLLLSEQLDAMEDGKPFEFPESEKTEESEEEDNTAPETELDELPEWHEKAGQALDKDELKAILKELDISFHMLNGQSKLQEKFDEYNIEKGYVVAPEETEESEEETEETVEKDTRGKKADEITLDQCIEDCQKAVMTLQQFEKQQRGNGKSSRRFRRAWQTINGQVIKKSLRRK